MGDTSAALPWGLLARQSGPGSSEARPGWGAHDGIVTHVGAPQNAQRRTPLPLGLLPVASLSLSGRTNSLNADWLPGPQNQRLSYLPKAQTVSPLPHSIG